MTEFIACQQEADGRRIWRISGHGDVRALLADKRLGKVRYQRSGQASSVSDLEHAAHLGWRKIMSRMFSPGLFDSLIPGISATADELTTGWLARGAEAEVRREYSEPLTARTMFRLLDVPDADGDCLRQDGPPGENGRSPQAMDQLTRYASHLVARRRADPAGDIVSQLLDASSGSRRVDDQRVTKLLAGMLAFGWETPASVIDRGVLLLLLNPGQRELLTADWSLIDRAVEEILRLSRPPVAANGGVHRWAHADVEVSGAVIRAGDRVMLDLIAANRDPRVFACPDQFDITRSPNPHVAFGHSFFVCNFARLARAEAAVGLRTLFERIPSLRLAHPDRLPGRAQVLDEPIPMRIAVRWDD